MGWSGKSDKNTPPQEEALNGVPDQQTVLNEDNAPEVVLNKTQPKRRGLGLLGLLFNLVFLAIVGFAGVFGYGYYKFKQPGPLQKNKIISVPKGSGLSKISNILEREGVIENGKMFSLAVYAKKLQKKLRAGEYSISAKASMEEVLDTLSHGKTFSYKVTIPEGWTSYKIVQRLNGVKNLTGDITEIPAEGSILPDTYNFSSKETRNQIIKRMQKARDVFLQKEWQNRAANLPISTPEEAMVLASIVEKETGIGGERFLIAGVFSNRLRKKMRLQSDPTIIYGLIGGKGPLGRGLRRSEIRKKTAYNTYQINGLPPTPIANPGREAIRAVLNPAKTEHLFFVANGTGGHTFARTNREHVNNVKKWRKIEKEMRKRQAEAKKLKEQEKKREAKTSKVQTPKL